MAEEKPEETTNEKSPISDVLGIQPVAKAVETVTDAAVKGAGEFLSRICLPAAEEYGLYLQDKVKNWRRNNLVKVLQKAEEKVPKDEKLEAHPRIVLGRPKQPIGLAHFLDLRVRAQNPAILGIPM